MKKNVLRELLNQGKPTLGTHVLIPWPGMAEVVGLSGAFDYIEYVGEYSTFTPEQLENFGRAIELFPNMSSMMKVEEQTRGFIAQRAIGHGIQNILFTDCRNADDVRECVKLILPETPEDKGMHGASMRRNVGYVQYSGTPEWVKAMEDTVIAFMIEKKSAMDELDEILSIPHVDMLQFGPNDYSISDGRPGQESRLPGEGQAHHPHRSGRPRGRRRCHGPHSERGPHGTGPPAFRRDHPQRRPDSGRRRSAHSLRFGQVGCTGRFARGPAPQRPWP